jgi:sugar phosphate isomerase/epimerase
LSKSSESPWRISFIPYYMNGTLKWTSPSPEEAVRVLSQGQFDGVEWMLGQHFNSPEDVKALATATRKSGLEISNIMCWQDFVTSDDDTRNVRAKLLESFIHVAAEMSIPIVNVFTGPITWGERYESIGRDISEAMAWQTVKEAFSKIVEAAERNDVVVTVEAVFGMLVHDYYTMRELLEHFDSKNLAVNLDPSHLVLYNNDPAWAVSRLGSRIKHVHVKDGIGRAGTFGKDFAFPFLGEGAVNWSSFLEALKKVDYAGYLSLEFENDVYLNNVCDGDWKKAAVDSRTRLIKLLKKSNLMKSPSN